MSSTRSPTVICAAKNSVGPRVKIARAIKIVVVMTFSVRLGKVR